MPSLIKFHTWAVLNQKVCCEKKSKANQFLGHFTCIQSEQKLIVYDFYAPTQEDSYLIPSFPQILKDTGIEIIRHLWRKATFCLGPSRGHSKTRCISLYVSLYICLHFPHGFSYMSVLFPSPFSFIHLFIHSFPEYLPLCRVLGRLR